MCLLGIVSAGFAQTSSAIPVSTTIAELRPITQAAEFVGRVEAIERVEIRARVTGFLQEILFKDGDFVKQGDVLYRVEKDSFDAAVQQAHGALLEAQGNFANAAAQLARTAELVKTNAAARAQLDERTAAQTRAQGEVVIAAANLKTATINLGYTEITAPISGEVGRTAITRGNVVGPDTGPLTVITSRDPMYVTFPVSQRMFLTLEKERQALHADLTVRLRFSDNSTYNQTGKIDYIDVTVARATDTVTVRATIANPGSMLIDGQLVRVSVEAKKPLEKVLVPQAALIVDQKGTYVFTITDGKAVVTRVKINGESGPYAIVEAGLKGGENVVVEGMESLRPGASVIASPAPPLLTGE
jgi:membrane fusion protein (multidrug efflux system)